MEFRLTFIRWLSYNQICLSLSKLDVSVSSTNSYLNVFSSLIAIIIDFYIVYILTRVKPVGICFDRLKNSKI